MFGLAPQMPVLGMGAPVSAPDSSDSGLAEHAATVQWVLHMFGFRNSKASQNPGPTHDELLRRQGGTTYPGEKIAWTPCGASANKPLECSSIEVPMDHFGKNSGDKKFTIPLIRLRGKNAKKNVLWNPGGPGGSGIQGLAEVGVLLNMIIGDEFNIISFDPRAVESSSPPGKCYASVNLRNAAETYLPKENIEHDAAATKAWAQSFVKGCASNMGEYASYINTPQTAADMNSIIDAVGQKNMYFWGHSYGSTLGQTYATMFPERAERIVVDGITNQFEWYGKALPSMDWEDAEQSLKGFFEECIKAGSRCPLSSQAKSADALEKKVLAWFETLRAKPISVYVDKDKFGQLNYFDFWFSGVFASTYNSLLWPTLASNLNDAMNGNATAAWLAYSAVGPFVPINEAIYFVRFNDGATGGNFWPSSLSDLNSMLKQYYKISKFLFTTNRFWYAKASWNIPKTHNYKPRKGVKTKHPLLVLSARYDPVCSLASARTARDSFVDSRLVYVDAYGHCSLNTVSSCAQKYTRDYFTNGTLPDKDVNCGKQDIDYFAAPDAAAAGKKQ